MSFTFNHTAEILRSEWIEVEFTIEAEHTPASRGSRGAHGEPEEPDEPEQIEILSCKDQEGKDYDWKEIGGVMAAANDYVDGHQHEFMPSYLCFEQYEQ